jgi:hypothetical protein
MPGSRDSATDKYLAKGRRKLAHVFDVDLGELMPGHHVILRGIEQGRIWALENPNRTTQTVDQLHYEIIPGLNDTHETPDWSIKFSDDVGTEYVYDDGGAYDTRLGLEATHGIRDIGDIPSNARVLTLTVGPSHMWNPPEPWSRTYDVDLGETNLESSRPKDEKVQVFAIVRIDKFFSSTEDQIAVQSVYPNIALARAEVERLNSLVDQTRQSYRVYTTRFYPNGRSPGNEIDSV